MRGTNAAKSEGSTGVNPNASRQFAVLIAPGWVRILRAVPHARGSDERTRSVTGPQEKRPEGTQAPFRASTWAEAAEGLPSGLHYLH
jgi:hypothetical protein